MNYEFVENIVRDLSFFENTLKSNEEMQMVNPSAKVPFDKNDWLNFFELGNPTTSYLLKYNQKVIGHAALQLRKENMSLWLCWVLIEESYRGKGCAQALLSHTEGRVKSEFNLDEYYLNVRKNNKRAISFYERNGFVKISEGEGNFQMKKLLS